MRSYSDKKYLFLLIIVSFLGIIEAVICQEMTMTSTEINVDNEILIQADEGPNSLPVIQFVNSGIFREIGLLGGDKMGIDGDVVPYNPTSGFDLGNNVIGENWDQVVCNQLIELVPAFAPDNRTLVNIPEGDILHRIRQIKINQYVTETTKTIDFNSDHLLRHFPEVFVNHDIDLTENQSEKPLERLPALRISAFTPILMKAIQEQQNQLDTQALLITKLIEEIDHLKQNSQN